MRTEKKNDALSPFLKAQQCHGLWAKTPSLLFPVAWIPQLAESHFMIVHVGGVGWSSSGPRVTRHKPKVERGTTPMHRDTPTLWTGIESLAFWGTTWA